MLKTRVLIMGEKEYFSYKGKPMLRKGNEIYYGNLEDKYIVKFVIEETEKLQDLEIGNRVSITLMTNEGKRSKPVRGPVERDGLYKAIDIGAYWLKDAVENY